MVVWHIEGIKSKLWDSDFISYLNTFDAFGLIETWDKYSSEDVKKKKKFLNSVLCHVQQPKLLNMAGIWVVYQFNQEYI